MKNNKQNPILINRREIIFIYDVTESNPNGDPDDSNRPRMNVDGYNIVTDVRLKRTIRDYWLNKFNEKKEKGSDVIVKRELKTSSTEIKSMEDLVIDALNLDKDKLDKKDKKYQAEALLKIINELSRVFIDVRAFGAAVTVKGATHQITGPVQFGLGKSLNKPEVKQLTITTTFASQEGRGAGTFGEYHIVDYSLILFHGIASEYSAINTGFSEEDLKKVYEGMWDGTRMLNTRSKFNHIPRVLISVVSKEKDFQVGGLDETIKLEDINVKSIKLSKLDLTEFFERLKKFSGGIEKIEYIIDPDVQLYLNGKKIDDFGKLNSGFNHVLISW